MQNVVLATGNAGKVRELAGLLADFGLDVVAQTALGVDSAEETGLTFIENAILKARHAARETGLPAIADDSGLAVDALGGAPGIYSARYAGEDAATGRIWTSCWRRWTTCRTSSVRPASTAYWCICATPTTRRRWCATAAGRASSPARLSAQAASATTRCFLYRRSAKLPPN